MSEDASTADAPALFQPVDDAARRLGKSLLRGVRYGALGVLDPETGAPALSRVNLAPDIDGRPIFLASTLSPHFRALEGDGRCSVLMGTENDAALKGDPLAHPRLAVAGRAERIADPAERARLRARFLGRHPKAALYVDFGDMAFWRLTPESASLNGGYGKAYAPAPADLVTPLETCSGLAEAEASAVAHMNDDHLDAVAHYARAHLALDGDGWRLASLDAEGLDLIRGDRLARLWFETPLPDAAALRSTLVALAKG